METMFIRMKRDGKWVDLSIPAAKVSFFEGTLSSSEWDKDDETGFFFQDISIENITEQYSVVALLEYKDKRNMDGVIVMSGAVRVNMKAAPERDIKTCLLYTKGKGDSSYFLIDTMTEEDIAGITEKIQSNLPCKISEDGFVYFEKVRKVTGIKNELYTEEERKKIKITTFLEGYSEDSFSLPTSTIDIIELDSFGYPIKGETDGSEWAIEWQGFEGL